MNSILENAKKELSAQMPEIINGFTFWKACFTKEFENDIPIFAVMGYRKSTNTFAVWTHCGIDTDNLARFDYGHYNLSEQNGKTLLERYGEIL